MSLRPSADLTPGHQSPKPTHTHVKIVLPLRVWFRHPATLLYAPNLPVYPPPPPPPLPQPVQPPSVPFLFHSGNLHFVDPLRVQLLNPRSSTVKFRQLVKHDSKIFFAEGSL